MAVVVSLSWTGVTPALYEQVKEAVHWDEDKPAGGILHIASFDAQGLYATDVWETPANFQAFVEERLMPAVASTGVELGEPQVEVRPLHALLLQDVAAYA
jgi:hypothetical protein